MGPPLGHRGHGCTFGGAGGAPVVHYDTPQCPACGGPVQSSAPVSKMMLDFGGDGRFMSYTRHTGISTVCMCGQVMMPAFPGIRGTFFGNEALRHILVYATRRSTDSDIVYYFDRLNKAHASPNSILNARHSISVVLEPSMQYILDELKKARFIQLDETPFKYRKRKAYVWVIRTDRVCMILALSGRGNDDILPFVKDLLDKPITVDGYSVYLSLFSTLQRCWAHILRDAEDVCISHPKSQYYLDLYRSLKSIFHRAKEVAAATAAAGGADMGICREMADEVRVVAAGYGRLDFANKLASAADNLFTFMRYPGMPPTNNGSERDIRDWVVPIREVSHKFMTLQGMRVFSILQSFAATCSKLHLDVGAAFLKVLDDPAYNVVLEGLRGDPEDLPMLPAPGTVPMVLEGLRGDPEDLPMLPAPHAAPMLPAPQPPVLPAVHAMVNAAPPPPPSGMITRTKPPALFMSLAMLAVLLASDPFPISPPRGRWKRAVNHHVMPVRVGLVVNQVGLPNRLEGG